MSDKGRLSIISIYPHWKKHEVLIDAYNHSGEKKTSCTLAQMNDFTYNWYGYRENLAYLIEYKFMETKKILELVLDCVVLYKKFNPNQVKFWVTKEGLIYDVQFREGLFQISV